MVLPYKKNVQGKLISFTHKSWKKFESCSTRRRDEGPKVGGGITSCYQEYTDLLNSQPRIMQFSDWFTVSRLPAIILASDLIWKLMRQMSLGVKLLAESDRRQRKVDEKKKIR